MARYLIALDAGHGINTAGKRTCLLEKDLVMDGKTYKKGSTIREREFNQRIMLLVEKELDKIKEIDYIECVEDIKTDTPLKDRVRKANNAKADLFVSIHANALAGSKQNKAQGLVCIHTQNCSTKSISLTNNMYKYLSTKVKWYKDGATRYKVRSDVSLTGNTYYVLRNTNMPATLLELGFMDNLNDVENMITDKFAKDCAKAITKALCDTLNVKYIETPLNANESVKQPSIANETIYRVCIGSFKERKNADEAVAKAKSKGYSSAFIIPYLDNYRVIIGSYKDRLNADKAIKEASSRGYTKAFLVLK